MAACTSVTVTALKSKCFCNRYSSIAHSSVTVSRKARMGVSALVAGQTQSHVEQVNRSDEGPVRDVDRAWLERNKFAGHWG